MRYHFNHDSKFETFHEIHIAVMKPVQTGLVYFRPGQPISLATSTNTTQRNLKLRAISSTESSVTLKPSDVIGSSNFRQTSKNHSTSPSNASRNLSNVCPSIRRRRWLIGTMSSEDWPMCPTSWESSTWTRWELLIILKATHKWRRTHLTHFPPTTLIIQK